MRRACVFLLALVCVAVDASGALGANRTTYMDTRGDACCTEDITAVVVSNDDAGRITIAITAPTPEDAVGSSDRFIKITTERDTFTIGTNSDGPGYVLSSDGNAVRASRSGDVFRFFIDRHRLADTNRFSFNVAFWAVSSFAANVDAAPDNGSWSYDVKIALDRIRPVVDVRQSGPGLTARLALEVGSDKLRLASGTIVCGASVGGRRLQVVMRRFVARRAVCVWKLPRWARGKVVRGSIGIRVTKERSSLRRRSFQVVVR
jgi:hypothetical protein